MTNTGIPKDSSDNRIVLRRSKSQASSNHGGITRNSVSPMGRTIVATAKNTAGGKKDQRGPAFPNPLGYSDEQKHNRSAQKGREQCFRNERAADHDGRYIETQD